MSRTARQDDAARQHHAARRQPLLPALTVALLVLLAVWGLVWAFVYRPPRAERLRVESFREAMDFVQAAFVHEVDRDALYRGAMRGMVESLGDRHSSYLSSSERQSVVDETEGSYVGIGVTIQKMNGATVIVSVAEGGPAEAAGVRPGDGVTHVDGEPVGDLSLPELAEHMRGPEGTRVVVGLVRGEEAEALEVELQRARVELPNVEWSMIEPGLAVVRVRVFDRNCAADLGGALAEALAGRPVGMLLDLRRNNGGLIREAVAAADLFIAGGVIISWRGREPGAEETAPASDAVVVPEDLPLAVLVDATTASSAEILAGALQAAERATLVGTQTHGKGSVTRLHRLPDGSGVMLTVAHYTLSDGRVIEGEGLAPDVVVGEVPPPPERGDRQELVAWEVERRGALNAQFERAVELVLEMAGRASPVDEAAPDGEEAAGDD